MLEKNIGIEIEFILEKDNEIVFPGDYGFSTDDYPILGELRIPFASTVEDLVANFYREWTGLQKAVETKKLTLNLSGHSVISPEQKVDALKRMGTKEIAKCNNIYGTDILKLSDDIIKDGELVGSKISAGTHIHFSCMDVERVEVTYVEKEYFPVTIPLSLGDGGVQTNIELYRRGINEVKTTKKQVARANVITMPVLKHFVKKLDEGILPHYVSDKVTLKYRYPGFYELKNHGGFEYRSLPFNLKVLKDLCQIIDFCFYLLNDLKIR